MRINFKQYLSEAEANMNQDGSFNMAPEDYENVQSGMVPPEDQPSTSAPGEEPEVGVSQDPDRQGILRKVKFAHLVYKRIDADGTFTELWSYNTGSKDKFRDELEIRRDILAGTDIPADRKRSDDGTQSYELWSVGNVQMMKVYGLPN